MRQRLREAFETRLVDAPTTVGKRVLRAFPWAIPDEKLPAVTVQTFQERSGLSHMRGMGSSDVLDRTLVVEVIATVAPASRDAEDDLDDLALEVETAVADDDTFGGLALSTVLVETVREITAGNDKRRGRQTMRFEVMYRTALGDPGEPA